MTVPLRIDLIDSDEGLHALEAEWNDLVAASAANTIFHRWEWVATWWKHFGPGYRLHLLAARRPDDGRLMGLAPLALHRRRYGKLLPFHELAFMGSGIAAADHLDFIVRSGEDATYSALFDALWGTHARWDMWNTEGLSAESLLVPHLEQVFPPTWRESIDDGICPYIMLPGTWDELRKLISKNLSYNIGRCDKRLERDYRDQVQHQRVQSQDEIDCTMESLFKLHQQVRQAAGDRGSFSDARMVAFHKEIARLSFERDWLRLYVLSVAGRKISVLYCIQYNRTVYLYQSGYDAEWASYSPGRAVVARAVKGAIEEGNHTFDFLRGDEAYKFQWNAVARQDIHWRLPSSSLGRMMIKGRHMRDRMHHWMTHLSQRFNIRSKPRK